jgi:hypothetical protein
MPARGVTAQSIEVEMGIAKFRIERQKMPANREGESVILKTPRAWPKGYWQRWGEASRSLELVEPLPPGGKSTETQDP